jgi:hypothetical protein
MVTNSSNSSSSKYITTLFKIASRYAPSRILSYNIAHVVIAIQLIGKNGIASRSLLCKELSLGEGSVKTLIKHMKMHGVITTSRAGTMLSSNGKEIYSYITQAMPREISVPCCSIVVGKANYAVRVDNRYIRNRVGKGIEQRDAAVKAGAIGTTTLVYKGSKFTMPNMDYDVLANEDKVRDILLEELMPNDGDIIVIGSADDIKVAEIATKYAILSTLL